MQGTVSRRQGAREAVTSSCRGSPEPCVLCDPSTCRGLLMPQTTREVLVTHTGMSLTDALRRQIRPKPPKNMQMHKLLRCMTWTEHTSDMHMHKEVRLPATNANEPGTCRCKESRGRSHTVSSFRSLARSTAAAARSTASRAAAVCLRAASVSLAC